MDDRKTLRFSRYHCTVLRILVCRFRFRPPAVRVDFALQTQGWSISKRHVALLPIIRRWRLVASDCVRFPPAQFAGVFFFILATFCNVYSRAGVFLLTTSFVFVFAFGYIDVLEIRTITSFVFNEQTTPRNLRDIIRMNQWLNVKFFKIFLVEFPVFRL